MIHITKRLSLYILCLSLSVMSFCGMAFASTEWPDNVSVNAQGAILIDADTGTVVWGQNIHNEYYPASITKIMTALLVIETCDMDEIVTFSHNAVFNVEKNSSSAGLNEGDRLTVKDCLYALLLKSANEAANALAEHVAGTTEAFADRMNERAKELGCMNTHFSNPSGLNDPAHYTSPYDMALIAKAAFDNPTFEEIDSATYYKLPPTSINKEGLGISPGHKMMKKSTQYYYPGVVGGKTGYTTLAGNTLVTYAKKNGMRLITVILKGSNPDYWSDTKNLLDFGFENFVSLNIKEQEKIYGSITNDLTFHGLSTKQTEALILDSDSRILLPKTASFADTTSELSYHISENDPNNAVARITYHYGDRIVGSTFLNMNEELSQALEASSEESSLPSHNGLSLQISSKVWAILGVVGVICILIGIIFFILHKKRKSDEYSLIRREGRMRRLQESGISVDEFNSILEQKRSSYTSKRKKRWGNRFKFR